MPEQAPARKPTAAIPVLYLLLGAVAALVQWRKWEAMHRTRNLQGALLAVFIMAVASVYLLRAFQAKRASGL